MHRNTKNNLGSTNNVQPPKNKQIIVLLIVDRLLIHKGYIKFIFIFLKYN
jgi:hypothetical protein